MNVRSWITITTVFAILTGSAQGACDYASLTTSLNNCMRAASGSSNTKWFFPYGSLAELATFCTGVKQSALASCVYGIFDACKLEAKSLKMFSTTGDNLVTAYSKLCSSSLSVEAQACMSVVSSSGQTSFTTAQTAFTTAVGNLPNAATAIEICGLATTMKYTAYTTLLSTTCTDSTHLAVWGTFFDDVMNTYVCTNCNSATTCHENYVVVGTGVLTSILLLFI